MKEKDRKETLRRRIMEIKNFSSPFGDSYSREDIFVLLRQLEAIPVDESFMEFKEEAEEAKKNSKRYLEAAFEKADAHGKTRLKNMVERIKMFGCTTQGLSLEQLTTSLRLVQIEDYTEENFEEYLPEAVEARDTAVRLLSDAIKTVIKQREKERAADITHRSVFDQEAIADMMKLKMFSNEADTLFKNSVLKNNVLDKEGK